MAEARPIGSDLRDSKSNTAINTITIKIGIDANRADIEYYYTWIDQYDPATIHRCLI